MVGASHNGFILIEKHPTMGISKKILNKKMRLGLLALIGFLLLNSVGNPHSAQGVYSNWSTTVVSTDSTGTSYFPDMAIDSKDNVYIAWYDNTDYASSDPDYDIFFKSWNAETGIWSATQVISTGSSLDSGNPQLVTDNKDNVHIVWTDYTDYSGSGTDVDIFYKFWNASTNAWSQVQVISTESTAGSVMPVLTVDNQYFVHVLWQDVTDYNSSSTDPDIFYKFRDANNGLWSTTEVVSSESTLASTAVDVVVDSHDNIHAIWSDQTDFGGSGTDLDIFYKTRDATTGIWSTTVIVSTESAGSSQEPSIAVDGKDDIHVTWHDATAYASSGADTDIFYKHRTALSGAWSTTEVVSTESNFPSYFSDIAVDHSNNVHVVWDDTSIIEASGSDTDIMYKSRNGTTNVWSTTQIVSSESTVSSYYGVIKTDNLDSVHVVWQDFTDYKASGTDWDVFYKRIINLDAIPNTVTETSTVTQMGPTQTVEKTMTVEKTKTESPVPLSVVPIFAALIIGNQIRKNRKHTILSTQ